MGLLKDTAFLFPQGGQETVSSEPVLLRQLLSLLRHIGQHVATSRMTCSNLAICLGPNMLTTPQEEQLELQAMLAENKKVQGEASNKEPAAASLAPAWLSRGSCAWLSPLSIQDHSGAAPQPQPSVQRKRFREKAQALAGMARAAWHTVSTWAETKAFLYASEAAGGLFD